MHVVGYLIEIVLWFYIVLLFTRFIVDWVQMFARSWHPSGVILVVLEGVYSATDPPLRAIRLVVPPLRLGSISLDLSLMLLLIAVYLLKAVNSALLLQ